MNGKPFFGESVHALLPRCLLRLPKKKERHEGRSFDTAAVV
jgi:hypothetical protein